MAEKKRNSSGSKSSGKTRSSRRTSTASGAAKNRRPIRREVGGIICLLLAGMVLLGMFKANGLFTMIFVDLLRGLIGTGTYVMPFALILDSIILLFHDGRPVRLRVTCTLIVALCIGVLTHLWGSNSQFDWSPSLIAELWESGVAGESGGVFAGTLAMFLELIISRIGAVLLTVLLLLLALLTSFNMTVGSLYRAIKNRPRLEYDPPVKEHRDAAEVLVEHVAQKQIQHAERRRNDISDFDLPVDDPPVKTKQPPEKPKTTEKSRTATKRDAFLESLEKAETENVPKERTAAQPQQKPVKSETLSEKQPEKEQMPPVSAGSQPEFSEPSKPEKPKTDAQAELELPPIAPADDPTPKVKKEEALLEAARIANEIDCSGGEMQKVYTYPPVSLLKPGDGTTVDGTEEMQVNSERLNDTLASFNIDAHIINVVRGPSVTRYELELDRGVKLAKITNLADDIALALGATGVRISAIPDKISIVGIEVPNKLVSTVHIHDVIDSLEFHKSKSKISFAVGKDISGKCIIGDIARMPHLLIAGTTGSGKSVCMNSLIISLLYNAKPEEVRLIMVDPKMVELGNYNGIPHLLIPVVTDPKKAAGALQWAVTEMLKRYRLMADAGVRDLDAYNRTCTSADDGREPMPQIVVIIDELADLMLVAAKEVEEAICRVAQMGRASGIHLVIATQRPSADVITGLMKANIPSRIAFAVASAMESRIILDTAGAEKLVGKGDMLFAPLGQGKPKRVQGCFITDEEVENVVNFIKKNETASYDDSIMEEINQKAEQSGKSAGAAPGVTAESVSDSDELLPAAVEVILETGQASVSMLQRRLKLGYARAARIVDEMEEKGIVGPFEGSKPRQLLITKEQWRQMQGLPPEEPMTEENLPVEEEIP